MQQLMMLFPHARPTTVAAITATLWFALLLILDRLFPDYPVLTDLFAVSMLFYVLRQTLAYGLAKRAQVYSRYMVIQLVAHHVANALQVLMVRQALPPDIRDMEIDKAVARLDWVLKNVLPQYGNGVRGVGHSWYDKSEDARPGERRVTERRQSGDTSVGKGA